jgi:hypothetical protein
MSNNPVKFLKDKWLLEDYSRVVGTLPQPLTHERVPLFRAALQ